MKPRCYRQIKSAPWLNNLLKYCSIHGICTASVGLISSVWMCAYELVWEGEGGGGADERRFAYVHGQAIRLARM